jgi:hypothetical protein
MKELAAPVAINEYYELRLYKMIPTRMPDFHDLMGVRVPALFARHGIAKPLGFWESHAGRLAPLFAYVIPWSNLDARMIAWKRFYADPEWVETLAANYAGQQRVERSDILILRPSPVWARFKDAGASGPVEGLHELRFDDVLNQDPNLAHESWASVDLPFLIARGGNVLGVFASWFGSRLNQIVTILAWPNAATMLAAHHAHQTDPAIFEARESERRTHGRPLSRGSDVHIMRPTPYGVPIANLAQRP